MNKTININLAGLFFHIDEDAYQRLQRYLSAVRKSFAGTSGADEIMADIESRIAELFLEKRKSEQQVIALTHVEAVIDIMGQPEDYEVDEEIFEENTGKRSSDYGNFNRGAMVGKQLFRDTQHGYIGGVSAGLGHFLGIEAIWVRAIWIILLLASVGWVGLIYVLIWVLVPDAVTTNQRLKMMGKEVNISNIEENFKSGFDNVADGPTDASYQQSGPQTPPRTVRFFSTLGNIIKGFFKALARIIGLVIFLTSTIALIGLIISFFTASFIEIENHNLSELITYGTPIDISPLWIGTVIILIFGMPLLALSILGMKLLVQNLKSIGWTAKIIMLTLWVLAVIAGSVMVARIAASQAIDGKVAVSEKFTIKQDKVFNLQLVEDTYEYDKDIRINGNRFTLTDIDGFTEPRMHDISTAITSTTDKSASVTVYYMAKGSSTKNAKLNAANIVYNYKLTDSTLVLDDFLKIKKHAKLNNQRVHVLVSLPEGTLFRINDAFNYNYSTWYSNDSLSLNGDYDNTFIILDGKIVCTDCPIIENEPDSTNDPQDAPTAPADSTVIESSSRGQWRYDGNDGVYKRKAQ